MQLIKGQPPLPPHRCAAFAYRNGLNTEERFVDTGTDIEIGAGYERLYLSEHAVREMSRLFGHPSAEDHAAVLAENEALRIRLEQTELQLQEADEELDKISYLKGRGYQQVKRAGRPPTTKKAA